MADARQRPGKLSVGVLSASQALLLITHLQKENGFELNLIFYKGGGPTVQDLLAGVTDMAITTLAAVDPHIRSRQAAGARHDRREARAEPARHADARRAGHQRPIRPIRGGASTRPPARRSRSSSA